MRDGECGIIYPYSVLALELQGGPGVHPGKYSLGSSSRIRSCQLPAVRRAQKKKSSISYYPSSHLWFYRRETAVVYTFGFWLTGFFSSFHLRPLAGALRVVSPTRCAVVRERLLSSGRAGLVTGGYLGLEFCRLLAPGLGWLDAPFRGALRPSRHSFED